MLVSHFLPTKSGIAAVLSWICNLSKQRVHLPMKLWSNPQGGITWSEQTSKMKEFNTNWPNVTEIYHNKISSNRHFKILNMLFCDIWAFHVSIPVAPRIRQQIKDLFFKSLFEVTNQNNTMSRDKLITHKELVIFNTVFVMYGFFNACLNCSL